MTARPGVLRPDRATAAPVHEAPGALELPRLDRLNRRAVLGMGIVVLFAIAGAMGAANAISWWNQAGMTVAAGLMLLVVLEGRRAASADDLPFRRGVVVGGSIWFLIQLLVFFEQVTATELGPIIEYPLVIICAGACALLWRAAVRGRLSGIEASAVYLDSSIVFAAVAAGGLLALGGSVLDGPQTVYALLFAALFFGMIGATAVLNLALAPVRSAGGWVAAVAGLFIAGLGLSAWLSDPSAPGWSAGLAAASVGAIVTGYGGATWTRAPDPSESYRHAAQQVREALPLMAAALSPLLWVLGEILRDQI
ncbi:MAG: hypothetical protein EHM90_07100, partial [Chloroflexi bacterium]